MSMSSRSSLESTTRIVVCVSAAAILLAVPGVAHAGGGGGGQVGAALASIGAEFLGIIQGPLAKWLTTISIAVAGIAWMSNGHHVKEKLLTIVGGIVLIHSADSLGTKLSALTGLLG
jgi:type IV secretory pathway VirB2 component (pilin)